FVVFPQIVFRPLDHLFQFLVAGIASVCSSVIVVIVHDESSLSWLMMMCIVRSSFAIRLRMLGLYQGMASFVCVRTLPSPGDSDSFPTLPSTPPAAACWAKLSRPCGAGFLLLRTTIANEVLTHTLQPCRRDPASLRASAPDFQRLKPCS